MLMSHWVWALVRTTPGAPAQTAGFFKLMQPRSRDREREGRSDDLLGNLRSNAPVEVVKAAKCALCCC